MNNERLDLVRVELGVTLIELMVTVAIVGILSAVAYPSYRNYITRSNRTEARAALLQQAHALEKCASQNGTYTDVAGVTPCPASTAAGLSFTTQNGLYRVTTGLILGPPQTFTITATPVAGGRQADDTDCASFSITSANQKSATGNLASSCW